jgi:hypothetical protein
LRIVDIPIDDCAGDFWYYTLDKTSLFSAINSFHVGKE